MAYWLGFDPGRDKCGVAVVGLDRSLQSHQVVAAAQALATVQQICQDLLIYRVVMGNGTTAKRWQTELQAVISVEITLVDERNSTLEARDRYWQMYPPQGWRKLVPKSIRRIDRPVDDIVAIILVERYLANLSNSNENFEKT
jgi:RNase H-fold protein (predicted Holliday junction resolvase)